MWATRGIALGLHKPVCSAQSSRFAGCLKYALAATLLVAAGPGFGCARAQTQAPQAQQAQAALPPEDSADIAYKASSYVPIDSWVYAALDRLTVLGYIQTGSVSIRPLTRLECARLLAEVYIPAEEEDSIAESLLDGLDREFAYEMRVLNGSEPNSGGTLERVYARYTGIGGRPLRDSFHFGQTIADDFGRPYGEGGNAVSGFSAYGEKGPFAIYARGEYQYAASSPAYSAAIQQAIVNYDETVEGWTMAPGAALPPPFNFNPAGASRERLIEGYASLSLANWQLSFGQQSLWWGPDRTTSLILSNNAAAMPMLRIARVKPIQLPRFLGWAGPLHFDAFMAREGGINFVALGTNFVLTGNPNKALTPPPYMWGLTLSIKPTADLEIGFAHTTIFAGYGRPLNLRTFFHTFSVNGNGQAVDPGKRVTEFNFAYTLPGLRRRLQAYTEAMAWDDPVQGHFTERYALDPGLYLPQLPAVKKLDLRMEGVYTDLPGLPEEGFFYANAHYPQGYTNYGQILGSWIGRQGRGGEATSTYWFSSRTKAAVSYRKMVAAKTLLQGGNLEDLSASLTWMLGRRIEVSTVQQYERWKFPLLNAAPQSNFASTFQIQLFSQDNR